MSDQWEDVDIPQGTYISWGEIGQSVTFEVVSYSEQGGTDVNGNICPQVVGVLTLDATNFRKGVKETLRAGEFITINASQANLSKAVRAAGLEPGILCRITFEDTYQTAKGTSGKAFKVQVNRAHKANKPSASELV